MNYPIATIGVLILSVLLPNGSWARSGGAPNAACDRIFPVGHSGASPSQDLENNPYTLDISAFDGTYTPGETYILTLSGTPDFRGLLVQARSVADDTPVGDFTAESGVTRLSSCDRSESAITHVNPVQKSSVQLQFTAPAAGTGPLRFLYAVVERFVVYYATDMTAVIDEVIIVEAPLELSFRGNTPMVIGNDITVNISVSSAVPLQCELVTRGEPRMPVISEVQDCSSGVAIFLNVPGGEHRVRVIAGDEEAVIRSRVILMPDNPFFCSLNSINNGITRVYSSNGTLISYIIEFRPIGVDVGFICYFGSSLDYEPCISPLVVEASDEVTKVKVTPDPASCPGDRRPLVFRLQ